MVGKPFLITSYLLKMYRSNKNALFFSSYLVAIGLESGKILMYKWSIVNGWKMMNNNSTLSHTGTVTRLKWRPSYTSNVLYLASCASDNSVKIHKILMT